MTATFWLDAGSGRFKIGNDWKSGSRLYQRRHNGFFFPDGLLIEFQRVEVNQHGPNGWDPTNVNRYSAGGDVLWEIQQETAGNGYREIRACPGGYLEATSRDGLRKYWLKATTGQVFPQEQCPDPKQVLSEEDRCTWSVTGHQVFYRGELRFEKPGQRIWSGYPVGNDLVVLWSFYLPKLPEQARVHDPRNVVRLRSDGTVVWLIEKEPIPKDSLPGAGEGFSDIRPVESDLVEVTSSNSYNIYRLDEETGMLTFLREEQSRW